MKKETYLEARRRLLEYLRSRGYEVRDYLKVPWAQAPDKSHKIWFQKQAVYLDDHSLFIDIRGMSGDMFVKHVAYMMTRRTSLSSE